MKLVGKLKEEVDKVEGVNEKKNLIKEAGMELTDEELAEATGGIDWTTLLSDEYAKARADVLAKRQEKASREPAGGCSGEF